MKIIYSLVFLFSLFSCKEKNEYHQNLDLVWQSKEENWNASSLIVNENFIYGHTVNDSIFKLNISSGRTIWKRYSRGTYSNLTPIISKNTILIGGTDKLKAFDKNGKLLWSEITNTKTIGLTLSDRIILNTRTDEGLFANSIKSGKETWNIKPKYQMLSTSNPSITDSLLILGNFDYKENIGSHLSCINIDKQTIKWEIKNNGYLNGKSIIKNNYLIINSDSVYQKGFTFKIELLTGKTLWKTNTNPVFHQPKLLNNKIFVPSYKNGIVCLNDQTGEIIWTINKEFYPDTELVFLKNILFFGTIKRELIGINEKGEVVFKSNFEYGIGNPFIYENDLYVSDGKGRLFKIKNTIANNV